jgi:hypothetical protein
MSQTRETLFFICVSAEDEENNYRALQSLKKNKTGICELYASR